MVVGDGLASIEVRDRARELEDPLAGAPGEAQLSHGAIEQGARSGCHDATPIHLSIGQARIAAALTCRLPRAGGGDAGGELGARFASAEPLAEIRDLQPRDLYMHVEPVEQGT